MGEAEKYMNTGQGDYSQQQQQYPQYGQQSGYSNGYHHQQQDQPPPIPPNYPQQDQQGPPPPHYGPPPQYSYNPPQGFDGEKYSFDQAFKIEKPKLNDLWAGILFLAFFLGFVAVSGISLYGYAQSRDVLGGEIYDSANDFSLNTNTIILFIFVLALALVFSIGYLALARMFTKQFIWITGILNIVWAIGTAIFYFIRQYWSGAVVFLIFGLFMAFCFWTWIKRIPFSVLMLQTSIDVSKKYGHVYLVSLIGGALACGLAAWYSITLVAIYVTFQPADNNPNCSIFGCSDARVIGLIAYCTFAMYWISEWLKNTIHTTISGVYGSWYFAAHNFPQAATRSAAKRALTYSFGSISLGSLLVAIVQALRQLCSIARQQSLGDGGIGGAIGYAAFCILGCLINILNWAVQFLNRYAFSHIALYGKAYFPAAKDTWKMIKNRGIDALINECLIGPVLSFGALFIGYACALLAYLYLLFTDPAYNNNGQYTAVVVAFAFLIGFQVANVFTTPLSSGIDTIFVAAGWDPQVMVQEHPELYNAMVKVYPKVQSAIPNR